MKTFRDVEKNFKVIKMENRREPHRNVHNKIKRYSKKKQKMKKNRQNFSKRVGVNVFKRSISNQETNSNKTQYRQ